MYLVYQILDGHVPTCRQALYSGNMVEVQIKRAYEEPNVDDGYRALVDRLWPRGVKKATLALDEWCKDVAPSIELRRWFNHEPARFDEFRKRYQMELDASDAALKLLDRVEGCDRLTLVYAAKDPAINHAVVLREYLIRCLKK